MNFLELCRELRAEAGFSGEGLPLTVINQTGELGRVVRWIRNSATMLQSAHPDWTFMRNDFQLFTIIGQAAYDLSAIGAADVAKWDRPSFRIVQDDGSVSLGYLQRDVFRRRYEDNPQTGMPRFWTDADGRLLLSHKPDKVYIIKASYQRRPMVMAEDTDVCFVPEQFQQAIVWKGLSYYGTHEEAPAAIERGEIEYRKILSQMHSLYLPGVRMPVRGLS
jgi:hypothetical protein